MYLTEAGVGSHEETLQEHLGPVLEGHQAAGLGRGAQHSTDRDDRVGMCAPSSLQDMDVYTDPEQVHVVLLGSSRS